MPPPPPPQPHRTPLNIDDVAIDFSGVAPAGSASAAPPSRSGAKDPNGVSGAPMIPGLLDMLQQQQLDGQPGSADRRTKVSDVRAFDPSLQGIAQRQLGATGATASRRKKMFGGQPFIPASVAAVQEASPTAATASNALSPPAQVRSLSAVSGGEAVMVNEEEAKQGTGVPADTSANSAEPASTAAQDALDFLLSAQQHQQSSALDLQQRREAYAQQLRTFCQRGRTAQTTSLTSTSPPLAFPSTSASHTNSLHMQLFADGVPDIEPWDRWTSAMPRYGEAKHLLVNPVTATAKQIHDARLDLIHHPAIPDTHYTRHYEHRDVQQPVIPKEFKTKEEMRAERRERLKEKQARKQKERAAAASATESLVEGQGTSGAVALTSSLASRLLHDRLSTKSLALNLFASSVLNPLAADTKVLQQYELRDLEHQRRNHARHVAALPDQILKRTRDQQRFATERPLLRAYRIFPIFSAAHLGKLRHYANDNLLRGCVLYVADCDAVVVLAGGEKAMRHLDHWILEKMAWSHPDTRATRLMTIPLMDAESFSFHLPKAQGARVYKQGKLVEGTSAVTTRDGATEPGQEPVFINMVPTVEEGEKFLRQLPAPSSPWADLTAIWRAAFLPDGLREELT